jgi:hypothetical protein
MQLVPRPVLVVPFQLLLVLVDLSSLAVLMPPTLKA